MNESHNNEDQENENVFVISGNLETFFNANEIKTFINKDEIYDLSSLPQNSDKKLLAEDGIDPQKGSEIHLPQSLDENNFMNIDCFPEQISENIRKLYDPEDPEQNSTNIEDTEKIRHPTSSVFYKTNEKSITESQSEKIPGFSPQLKKEIESKEEKNFVKDEIPLTKIKTKDFKSSNILTKLQNSSQHLKKTEIFHDKVIIFGYIIIKHT